MPDPFTPIPISPEPVWTPYDPRDCIGEFGWLWLERKLRMRRRVYPRWVQAGRITQAQAEREIAVMEAISADYPEPQERML